MSVKTRRTQADRRAATRAALISSARELFTEHGYARTGLDQIVANAGVTRGALYHHFGSKAELFAAVVAAVDDELAEAVVAAALEASSASEMIRLAARAYLRLSARSENARIVADAASVLGPEVYHSINGQRCFDLLQPAVAAAIDEGVSVPGDPAVLSAMVLGALDEASVLSARASGSRKDRQRVADTVDAVLERLFR